MRLPRVARRSTLLAGAGIALLALIAPAAAAAPLPGVAVATFSYLDTSGEARDQTAEHAARLTAFMASLRADLSAGGKFRVVALPCDPCTLNGEDTAPFIATARQAGADFVLVGGIHKMSTLVQWAKVSLIDLKTGKTAMERLYTFRGDTDEAWKRAEQFIAGQIGTATLAE